MSGEYNNEPMIDMYIFETSQNIEQLEICILSNEKSSCYTQDAINEIFRIMHTIKGSSAMMLFNNISMLAHSMEDLFYYIRENKLSNIDCSSISDLVLECVDFIKVELQKIKCGDNVDGDCSILIGNIKESLLLLKHQNPLDIQNEKLDFDYKQHYYISQSSNPTISNGTTFKATIFFEDECEMENLRAYTVIDNLKEITEDVYFLPADIIENDDSAQIIKEQGFIVYVKADKSYEEMYEFFMNTILLKDLKLIQLENDDELRSINDIKEKEKPENIIQVESLPPQSNKEVQSSASSNIINVNLSKLDKLMDLVGEMVIAEAIVIQNPDLKGLELDNFQKAARQLQKITNELQNVVMSIRMLPIESIFHKMQRIVRDMCKKLGKEVDLELIGKETEVDKKIIEYISDPLMHLIRNSLDHGIECSEDRIALGKSKVGTVTLEAKNEGSNVLVIVRDDGRGLNKEKILQRARQNGLLTKNESEMTENEIYSLIFLPGFSTKDSISEFSGRGVGMDVVTKNIESVGGIITVDSIEGIGTTITLKIPLTLAIIDGMTIQVGNSKFTIPISTIKESFRPKESDLIKDPDGNEMIMVRGQCYSILRLHKHYGINTGITEFTKGILIMVEQDERTLCIFADQLLSQQQVVVKELPSYIKNIRKIQGLAGCALLGDGSISLIIDTGEIINVNR